MDIPQRGANTKNKFGSIPLGSLIAVTPPIQNRMKFQAFYDKNAPSKSHRKNVFE